MSIPKFKRILIAVDEETFSQTIIDYSKALDLNSESSIALLIVVPPIPADQLGFDPVLGQQSVVVPELVDVEQKFANEFINKFKKQFPEVGDITTYTKIGTPAHEIINLSQAWNADLIVMGTHGRTGFDHFISGSVSESVTRKASCPILIIPTKVD